MTELIWPLRSQPAPRAMKCPHGHHIAPGQNVYAATDGKLYCGLSAIGMAATPEQRVIVLAHQRSRVVSSTTSQNRFPLGTKQYQ